MDKKSKDNEENETSEDSGDSKAPELEKEVQGYEDEGLLEPTRFGDWEVNGICRDF